jgi:DNA-binding PadR family transcriptional regulator
MRRRRGTGLVRNERKVLAAALRLAWEGSAELYGYELFARLRDWEGEAAMDHGTLYRCLRALEGRGFFGSSADQSTGRLRVNYRLSETGVAAARQAVIELAAEERPPTWVDLQVLFGWRQLPSSPV